MRHKAIVTLIYQGKQIAEDGSPTYVTIRREVQGYIEESFSQYYYRESHREMRKSRNISVPLVTIDLNDNGIEYELLYVEVYGVKYQVQNILKHGSTSMMRILDCQEVTQ